MESILNQEIDEDNDFVYQIIATDIDNENLLYGVSSSANSDFSIDGSFLTFLQIKILTEYTGFI